MCKNRLFAGAMVHPKTLDHKRSKAAGCLGQTKLSHTVTMSPGVEPCGAEYHSRTPMTVGVRMLHTYPGTFFGAKELGMSH